MTFSINGKLLIKCHQIITAILTNMAVVDRELK